VEGQWLTFLRLDGEITSEPSKSGSVLAPNLRRSLLIIGTLYAIGSSATTTLDFLWAKPTLTIAI
jgi:hypothetical protein